MARKISENIGILRFSLQLVTYTNMKKKLQENRSTDQLTQNYQLSPLGGSDTDKQSSSA